MLLWDGLASTGWQQCVANPCIYTFHTGSVFAMTALYVDDIPAACNDTASLTSFTARLGARFKIKDLGALPQVLGKHITRDRSARTISLGLSKCLRDILDKHGMTLVTPYGSRLRVRPRAHHSPPLTGVAKGIYSSLLGTLQYAAVCTRPHVSKALSILGSAQTHPTEVNLQALKKVTRYLKGTIQLCLTLGGGPITASNAKASPTPAGRVT
jgi:hypothetical protein